MHETQRSDFGLRITFWKGLQTRDIRKAVSEIREYLEEAEGSFSILTDWREVSYISKGAESHFALNENVFKDPRLYRVVGLTNSKRTDFDGFNLGRISDEVVAKIRTFDEAKNPDAEKEATAWARGAEG